MCATEQYQSVCKGEFAEINGKLDRLDKAIRGNGHPGILLRLDRIETARANRGRLFWVLVGAIASGLATGAATLIIQVF